METRGEFLKNNGGAMPREAKLLRRARVRLFVVHQNFERIFRRSRQEMGDLLGSASGGRLLRPSVHSSVCGKIGHGYKLPCGMRRRSCERH